MLTYLPILRENESMSSIVIRYANAMGYELWSEVAADFYGKEKSNIKFNGVCGIPINILYEKLPADFPYKIEEFIQQHTYIYIYNPFISLAEREIVMMGARDNIRLLERYVGRRPYDEIKYCMSCVNEDRKSIGELYLRSQHQIPNNLICSKHKEALRMVRVDSSKVIDLNHIDEFDYQDLCEGLDEEERMVMYNVALDLDYIQSNKNKLWQRESTKVEQILAALKKGYVSARDINYQQVASILIDKFSLCFFEKVNWISMLDKAKKNRTGAKNAVIDKNPIHQLILMRAVLDSDPKKLEQKKLCCDKYEYERKIDLAFRDEYRKKFLAQIDRRKYLTVSQLQGEIPGIYLWLKENDFHWVVKHGPKSSSDVRQKKVINNRRQVVIYLETHEIESEDELDEIFDRPCVFVFKNDWAWYCQITYKYKKAHKIYD